MRSYGFLLHTAGYDDICGRLESLESKIDQGFEAVIATIQNEQASEIARAFKEKMRLITMKYDDLVQYMVSEIKSKRRRNSSLTEKRVQDTANDVERLADDLYAWASTFVPDPDDQQEGVSKQTRLSWMPYVMAMAYANRAKTDAHMVMSYAIRNRSVRENHLSQSQKKTSEFIELLFSVAMATIKDTSLLEVALDYHLTLKAYVILISALKMNQKVALGSGNESAKKPRLWDDGLSSIR